MADVGDLRAKLTAEVGDFLRNMAAARDASVTTGRSFEGFGASIVTLNQGLELAGRVLGTFVSAGRSLVSFLRSATAEASEAEDAQALLNATLRQSDQFTQAYADELDKLSQAYAGVSRESDEAIKNAERLLIAYGATREQLPDLVQGALDFSAATGRDLTTAVQLLNRALVGETGALSRYGITVDESASKSEKLASIVKQLNDRFGGAAATAAQTYAGRIRGVEKAYADTLETVGKFVTENEAVLAVVDDIADAFDSLNRFLAENQPAIDAIVTSLADLARIKLTNVLDFLEGAAESRGLATLAGGFGALATGLREADNRGARLQRSLEEMESRFGVTARAASRFEGVIEEIGPRGERSFRNVRTSLESITDTYDSTKREIADNPLEIFLDQTGLEHSLDRAVQRAGSHQDLPLRVGFYLQHDAIAVLLSICQRQQDIEHSGSKGK